MKCQVTQGGRLCKGDVVCQGRMRGQGKGVKARVCGDHVHLLRSSGRMWL